MRFEAVSAEFAEDLIARMDHGRAHGEPWGLPPVISALTTDATFGEDGALQQLNHTEAESQGIIDAVLLQERLASMDPTSAEYGELLERYSHAGNILDESSSRDSSSRSLLVQNSMLAGRPIPAMGVSTVPFGTTDAVLRAMADIAAGESQGSPIRRAAQVAAAQIRGLAAGGFSVSWRDTAAPPLGG